MSASDWLPAAGLSRSHIRIRFASCQAIWRTATRHGESRLRKRGASLSLRACPFDSLCYASLPQGRLFGRAEGALFIRLPGLMFPRLRSGQALGLQIFRSFGGSLWSCSRLRDSYTTTSENIRASHRPGCGRLGFREEWIADLCHALFAL